MKRPAPTPPVEARPRELSVTDIEKWVRDPYAIYAKRILTLRTLDPLDAEIGPMERGSAVHKALEIFVSRFPGELPPDAVLALIAIADEVFAAQGTPKAALALWRPRFAHAAAWFIGVERIRRTGIVKSHVEVDGRLAIGENFRSMAAPTASTFWRTAARRSSTTRPASRRPKTDQSVPRAATAAGRRDARGPAASAISASARRKNCSICASAAAANPEKFRPSTRP